MCRSKPLACTDSISRPLIPLWPPTSDPHMHQHPRPHTHTRTPSFSDIIMAGHFGLAVKKITEALLPGGSLNPPAKAINPLITVIGAMLGPIGVYFIVLNVFWNTV